MLEGINRHAGQRSRGRYLREGFLQCQFDPSLLLVSYRQVLAAGRGDFLVVYLLLCMPKRIVRFLVLFYECGCRLHFRL